MYHFLQKLRKLLKPSPVNANLVQKVPVHFLPFIRDLQIRTRHNVPIFNFFRHCKLFLKTFQCLKRVPFRVCSYFATKCMLMNPKGSPLFIFRHYTTFFERKKYEAFSQKLFFTNRGKSDFPVKSSIQGTLWVSRNCFQSFS